MADAALDAAADRDVFARQISMMRQRILCGPTTRLQIGELRCGGLGLPAAPPALVGDALCVEELMITTVG